MLEFLAMSGVIMWGTIILVLSMIVLLENEREGWVTTFLSLGVALWLFNYNTIIWDYITTNPLMIVGFIIGYIVIGVGWSFVKWGSYIKTKLRPFVECKNNFITQHGEFNDNEPNPGETNELWERFKEHYRNTGEGLGDGKSFKSIINRLRPSAAYQRGAIISWVSYWPLSIIGTLLNDPLRRFFGWVYDGISGYYDKLTDKLTAKALE